MEGEIKYPIKIIYAEDNPIDIDLTRKAFENLSNKFEFTFVGTGRELLEFIKNESYDLILLDNHLPDFEGVNLISKIIEYGIKTPIILITGLGDEEIVLKAIRCGATDYISKSEDYLEKLPEYFEKAISTSTIMKTSKMHIRPEKIKVLYIERDKNDIELVKYHISKTATNIELTCISNSLDALNIINEKDFDLFLVDLRMPDIDAIELVRRLKDKKIDIPIIIVTGKGDEKSAIEAIKLGVYDYVSKDIDYIEKLPRIIETSYLRYKYEKSTLNHEKKYLELQIVLEQQFQERTLSLVKEIERRKESEAKFYELFRLFENSLNSIGDLVIVKDKDLNYFFVNNAFQSFVEIGLEDIRSGLVNNAFNDFQQVDYYLDLNVRDALSETTKLVNLKDKNGNIRYFEVKKAPFFDENKNFSGLISIYRDLTERIILENEIKISEEKYKSFVELSSELIACFEMSIPVDISSPELEQLNAIFLNTNLSKCNLTFIENFGYSSFSEVEGNPLSKFLPLISETNREMIISFINSNYSLKNFESKELNRDGEVKYYLNSMIGIVEESELKRIWFVKRDITELKKLYLEMEERIEERTNELLILVNELENFNSAVSHDLKAPIRAIVGFGEMLFNEHSEKLDSEGRELLNDIINNGKKLQMMLEDLLRLSKLSILELKLEYFPLQLLISEIIADFSKRNELEKAEVIIGELPDIYGDRALIALAFNNLISNAIKFSSKNINPRIEIGSFKEEKHFVIFVKDNGVGFDKKYSSKLFKPFQRLHSELEFPGTGIGLAIVKSIIDKHNWKIRVESEMNQGTTFYISLPIK